MLDVFCHGRARDTFQEWSTKDCISLFPNFSNNLITTPEITYQYKPHFDRYKDNTLMIVGGGPSSNNNWEDSNYDFLWSMNHFFLNKKLQDKKVDLAMIMGEPDVNSKFFLDYVEKYKPYLGFEIHDKWFNYTFNDYPNYFCMHTRFYGRVGAGARMLIFAAHLGFKNVLFTGFDGPEPIFNGNHAFEPGKKTLPSCFTGYNIDYVREQWKLQSDYLWDYIHDLYPNTNFANIGGGDYYHERC